MSAVTGLGPSPRGDEESTEVSSAQDVVGVRIGVGDTIAGAFRIGNVAVLRVGEVLGFGERAHKPIVKVRWYESSREGEGEIIGGIEADLGRFVAITSDSAPDYGVSAGTVAGQGALSLPTEAPDSPVVGHIDQAATVTADNSVSANP